jgi:peptidase C25-like protein/BACON domain-containing protein/all-beta uncharacterized protein
MKKAYLSIFAIFLLGLPASAVMAGVVEMEIAVPNPQLFEDDLGFTHVHVEGYANIDLPGSPSLPSRAVNILVPPGHAVQSVSITPSEAIDLHGSHLVFPVQRPMPIGSSAPVIFTQPDPSIYETDAIYPVSIENTPDTQHMRGFGIQPVVVRPVFYRPLSGSLAYYPWLKISVTTYVPKHDNQDLAAYRGFPRDFSHVAKLVDNPQNLELYPERDGQLRNPDYRYIIVTNQAMSSCSGSNLQALAADKEGRGISTLIKTMEDIRSEYTGSDDAEKVRNFIKDMYENHGTDFVLLAGDADLEITNPVGETQAPVVPVRGLFGTNGYDTEDDNIPSDLYYSCLDGDFNSDGDNRWGESNDNTDLIAEVWVGRAPVDTCNEVSNFVSKTLAYQNATGNWLQNVKMVGEWLWESEPSFGKDYLEFVVNSSSEEGLNTKGFSESSFFTVTGLYDKDQSGANCQGQPSPCWDEDDIISLLNGGNHIINHLGHSYTYYNMRIQPVHVRDQLNNTNYFFEYSQGCYPGSFDNRLDPQEGNEVIWQDSFAEYMVLEDHGAFAAVMNTRYGWGGGVSNNFNRTFWDGVFDLGITRLGELQAHSQQRLSGWATNPYYRWVYYECTLFGDPEVALHTSSSTQTPTIGLSDTDIWFVALQGGEPPNDWPLTVRNDGGGSLNWSVASDQTWLTVDPASGTAPSDITLSVDASGLATDTYEATLTFPAPGASNSPFEITVELYVITVPSVVAPYFETAAPVVDGTIGASEYNGATVIEMGSWDDENNTVKVMHNNSMLYMAFDIPSDTDEDVNDYVRIYVDNNADDLWPTTEGDEGLYIAFAAGGALFSSFWFDGADLQTSDWEDPPPGVTAMGSMSGGHRVIEVSFDLASSHLVRSMGDTISMFLYYEDFVSGEEWDPRAMWPYAIGTMDNTQYFADITLGTDTDNLTVNPQSLDFFGVEDGEPTDWVNLTIGSTTTNPLNFNISNTGSWIRLSETSGTTPAVIRVWAVPGSETPGLKNGSIQVSASGVGSVSVPVTFDIEQAPPAFGVNPAGMYFDAEKGETLPPSQNLSIGNTGSAALNWTATKVGTWFTLSQESGSGSAVVSVRPNSTDLNAGFHSGAILLSAPGAESVQVELSYTINVPPILMVDPVEIVRQDALAGGPVELELKVINAEFGTMTWTVNEFSPWITLEPTSGSAVTGHPGRVAVTLDPSALSAGLHEADITVSAAGASGSPKTVHVAWTLADAAAISASPASLTFNGSVGGSNPSAQAVQITNAGPGTMNWTVTCAETWLACTPASGTAPGSVSVTPAISGLAEGVFSGNVVIESVEAANSPVSVPVTLTLTDSGQNQAPPAPTLISPPHQAALDVISPELTVQNVIDPNGDTVSYSFEVYEKGSVNPSVTINNVLEGTGGMTYTNLNATLAVGVTYQWRARAVDQHNLAGPWSVYWEFSINGDGGGGGCGCASTAQGGWSGVLLFALLLGLAVIRRK